uniref:Putative secreted protein n=1 Tax=Rhipicephalus microplus TaxID=6941 RepID=A0A6M2D8Z0_RHIMP
MFCFFFFFFCHVRSQQSVLLGGWSPAHAFMCLETAQSRFPLERNTRCGPCGSASLFCVHTCGELPTRGGDSCIQRLVVLEALEPQLVNNEEPVINYLLDAAGNYVPCHD